MNFHEGDKSIQGWFGFHQVDEFPHGDRFHQGDKLHQGNEFDQYDEFHQCDEFIMVMNWMRWWIQQGNEFDKAMNLIKWWITMNMMNYLKVTDWISPSQWFHWGDEFHHADYFHQGVDFFKVRNSVGMSFCCILVELDKTRISTSEIHFIKLHKNTFHQANEFIESNKFD